MHDFLGDFRISLSLSLVSGFFTTARATSVNTREALFRARAVCHIARMSRSATRIHAFYMLMGCARSRGFGTGGESVYLQGTHERGMSMGVGEVFLFR